MTGREESFMREAFSNQGSSPIPNTAAFEAELGMRIGLPCVALSSGTAGIHLGLELLGVGPGDEVLCSTLTFVASANPIVYLGARPVFIDSEASSWNMDPRALEIALEARRHEPPKAIVVVHLYGQSADLDPILELAERYGVPVLEDAAEALGATYKGQPVGSFGDVAVFSFNSNKIITTTGGGAMVARDPKIIERARLLANQARLPTLAFEHAEVGYNYRLSQVLAGIGRAQIAALDDRVTARRAIASRYARAFADVPGIAMQPECAYGQSTFWLSAALVGPDAFGATRDELIAALAAADIESRPVWKPMHQQPLFAGADFVGRGVAQDLFQRGICLPSSSQMTLAEQDRVIECVRRRHTTRAKRHTATTVRVVRGAALI